MDYLKLTVGEGGAWGLMRSALATVADTVILTAQDLLGLGSEARMNEPSTLGKNWQWRAGEGVFTPELAHKLRRETALYYRLPR